MVMLEDIRIKMSFMFKKVNLGCLKMNRSMLLVIQALKMPKWRMVVEFPFWRRSEIIVMELGKHTRCSHGYGQQNCELIKRWWWNRCNTLIWVGKSHAHANWCKEEVLLLKEEMCQVLVFLQWKSDWWLQQQGAATRTGWRIEGFFVGASRSAKRPCIAFQEICHGALDSDNNNNNNENDDNDGSECEGDLEFGEHYLSNKQDWKTVVGHKSNVKTRKMKRTRLR